MATLEMRGRAQRPPGPPHDTRNTHTGADSPRQR